MVKTNGNKLKLISIALYNKIKINWTDRSKAALLNVYKVFFQYWVTITCLSDFEGREEIALLTLKKVKTLYFKQLSNFRIW